MIDPFLLMTIGFDSERPTRPWNLPESSDNGGVCINRRFCEYLEFHVWFLRTVERQYFIDTP